VGRSKEYGKLVEELTAEELRRERDRCRVMATLYGNRPAGKPLCKRLHEIERRLERDFPDEAKAGSGGVAE
jgi:hypothetical protein